VIHSRLLISANLNNRSNILPDNSSGRSFNFSRYLKLCKYRNNFLKTKGFGGNNHLGEREKEKGERKKEMERG
jgi:hypothetical protein